MTAVEQYFLYFGTISKATMLADPANNIENWPMQSDQPSPAYGWTEPTRDLTKRLVFARVSKNGDLSTSGDGFFELDWGFAYWTFGQMSYVLNTGFGGVNTYATLSTPVTLQTFFETGYVAAHALLKRPIWGEDFQTEDGGYKNIALRFTRGVVIS